ncbi:MAG: helix-turn-helix domain-containing protein [Acidobacteriota bacterium]
MERKRFEQAPCSIARSLDIIGDWWSPLIIRECLYGTHRFDGIQRWLGIGRNILTRRLTLLVEQGVLEKRRYQERPARYEYHLTDKGYDAAQMLVAMMPFGESWLFDDAEPIRLFDRRTDRRVRPQLVDADTGEPLDMRQLYAGPGPAFPAVDDIRRERFTEFYARRDGRVSEDP